MSLERHGTDAVFASSEGQTMLAQSSKHGTPQLAAVVWMGRAVPGPIRNPAGQPITGETVPAQLWKDFMQQTLEGQTRLAFLLTPRAAARPAPPRLRLAYTVSSRSASCLAGG